MTDQESFYHQAVMPDEVIEALQVHPGKKYIDATLGGGGHALKIIKSGGELLGIDRDPNAISFARKRLFSELPPGFAGSFTLVRGNFKDIVQLAKEHNFETVDGVLMDIGVSSFHFDQSGRGFSYKKNEPLDMRMDPQDKRTAFDVINTYPEQKLYALFLHFGETHLARELARRIASARGVGPISTTEQLVTIVQEVSGETSSTQGQKEARTLAMVFQAIRIEVNLELDNLREGLNGATNILNKKGRLVVLSFHSLEDRIVKLHMKQRNDLREVNEATPSSKEVTANSRARSARLRCAEKK